MLLSLYHGCLGDVQVVKLCRGFVAFCFVWIRARLFWLVFFFFLMFRCWTEFKDALMMSFWLLGDTLKKKPFQQMHSPGATAKSGSWVEAPAAPGQHLWTLWRALAMIETGFFFESP